ncbi:MAG: hypothetical protein OEV08_02540 [Nitrospira sp.]|nr:hypothetical protein [Nitrospira sp.]
MNAGISDIVARMAELERHLERALLDEVEEQRRKFLYVIERGKVAFEPDACAEHRTFRQNLAAFLREAPVKSLLVAPLTYSLIVPLVILDVWLWLFQALCFSVYGIVKVERARYIALDRGHLQYLNAIERLNCNYCGYANGLIAYAREVAARTEQYFCPIKHARRCAGAHARYQKFLDFGDAGAYRKELAALRADLRS